MGEEGTPAPAQGRECVGRAPGAGTGASVGSSQPRASRGMWTWGDTYACRRGCPHEGPSACPGTDLCWTPVPHLTLCWEHGEQGRTREMEGGVGTARGSEGRCHGSRRPGCPRGPCEIKDTVAPSLRLRLCTTGSRLHPAGPKGPSRLGHLLLPPPDLGPQPPALTSPENTEDEGPAHKRNQRCSPGGCFQPQPEGLSL